MRQFSNLLKITLPPKRWDALVIDILALCKPIDNEIVLNLYIDHSRWLFHWPNSLCNPLKCPKAKFYLWIGEIFSFYCNSVKFKQKLTIPAPDAPMIAVNSPARNSPLMPSKMVFVAVQKQNSLFIHHYY